MNALHLGPGDRVEFKRGTLCTGELAPQGSGNAESPIRMGAYGVGALPKIKARDSDTDALRLFNQSYWEIDSLDLEGGTTYGFYAGGDGPALHHLRLKDLLVHDVRGPLKHKDSGAVVIGMPGGRQIIDGVDLDGVHAYNTTQWAGIFVSGAANVRVINSTVHDVQGDGIIVFNSHNALIARSLAWHTGMQHQLSIGTPNAIWTWNCTDCIVEDNEAFLTDSPGVDGGSFDIDFGNTRNTVRRNFGHDTAGYCVSVFGALGPTVDSVVSNNLCIDNGLSPRLAQRQGAILLMTWEGGSLEGVQIQGNQVDWEPGGDVPVVQSGNALQAHNVTLVENDIRSSTLSLIDPHLGYRGERNHYTLLRAGTADLISVGKLFRSLPESNSVLRLASSQDYLPAQAAEGKYLNGWQLHLEAPFSVGLQPSDDVRGTLVELKSEALQFGHAGLSVTCSADARVAQLGQDWQLSTDGVLMNDPLKGVDTGFALKLISPLGKVLREWHSYVGPADLGLVLRKELGAPDLSRLPMEKIRATD